VDNKTADRLKNNIATLGVLPSPMWDSAQRQVEIVMGRDCLRPFLDSTDKLLKRGKEMQRISHAHVSRHQREEARRMSAQRPHSRVNQTEMERERVR